jgi:hypothetical protein
MINNFKAASAISQRKNAGFSHLWSFAIRKSVISSYASHASTGMPRMAIAYILP